MRYDEYYHARDIITNIIQEDILGPLDENEVLEESPISYYLVGKLYPRKVSIVQNDEEDEESFVDAEILSLGNGGYPSAMGMTFAITKGVRSFVVNIESAKYILLEEYKWKRIPISYSLTVDVNKLCLQHKIKISVDEDLVLQVSVYDHSDTSDINVTVTLMNTSETADSTYQELSQHSYFKPKISVSELRNGNFLPLYNANITVDDDETKELELLYHDVQSFAVGHGISVDWEKDESGQITKVFTMVIPYYDLLQMRPSDCIDRQYLSMKYLANANQDEIIRIISELVSDYDTWIKNQEREAEYIREELISTASINIKRCKEILSRLEKTKALMKDQNVFAAFKYANQTMLEQRICMSGKECISDETEIRWYPFQLAFILLELDSIVNPEGDDRKLVDLLWFPTGGGKTEAYLGIAAFTLFYRRIRLQDNDAGVAVFMRYTLRLLSFQQFERAAAMICAAEKVRRENSLGGKEFGIGLWAGESLTPNTISDADDYLRGKSKDVVSPAQLKKFPWCHTQIFEADYSTDVKQKRMYIRCHNDKCLFHQGLPIHLVDEDIYVTKPSFIIGTIDKFAQVAFKEEAGCLLGVDMKSPPELIIQDELHLISGPLGTITGLYEAAITKLCSRGDIKPKIIASTATIKNAKEQIKALYGMGYAQFPPQGMSINDSFFACLSDAEKKASRRYMGILASGISRALTFNRIMGALLFASRYLIDAGFSEDVIDSFWTETGYFNTLRELGSALSRIVDSVQDRYQYLKNTKFKDKYPLKSGSDRYDRYFELTSRQSTNNLGEAIQNSLLISYKSDLQNRPYDFLVASNMISVGVDVSRLNAMLVVGQPIKTSEYIQSSSRVGRSTPGLVIVEYHPSMVRDRSFYEQFVQFHSSMYKFVEATSITPFSDRARDRALQALYVILCRYYVPELRGNKDAKNFKKEIPKLEEVRRYILDYVSVVDPDELENVEKEIADIETIWEDRASHSSELIYWSFVENDHMLFRKDYLEGDRFRMMNSMRSVEQAINVYVEE